MKARIATVATLIGIGVLALVFVPAAGATKWYWSQRAMENYLVKQANATDGYYLYTNRRAIDNKNVVCARQDSGRKVYNKNHKFKGFYYHDFYCTFYLISLDATPDSYGYIDCTYLDLEAIPQSSRTANLINLEDPALKPGYCKLAGY